MSILTRIKTFLANNAWDPSQSNPKLPKRVKGKIIVCQECRRLGYEAYLPGRIIERSEGWHCIRAGMKHYYVCPDCLKAIRKRWQNHRKLHPI